MKTKTTKSSPKKPRAAQSKPISKAQAAKEALKFGEYADQDRKSAHKILNGIEALIAGEKASAERYFLNADRYDLLADELSVYAESDG